MERMMMSMYKNLTALTVVAVLAMSPAVEAGKDTGRGGPGMNVAVSMSLSQEEMSNLEFMREEEKLARDVYRVLYDQWGKPVFSNISSSEQSHMDALLGKINFYRLSDPVVDDSTGAFVNTDLAGAYLSLTGWGMTSLEDALRVGAYIEELDILDLQHAIEGSSHADLDATYEKLMRGSRNHMRAFVGAIENMGITYTAKLMDQPDVDEIVDINPVIKYPLQHTE
jgi:hypothetical protein